MDLRDEYGVTQVVFHDDALLKGVRKESVISVTGKVVKRDPETVNKKIATGELEVHVTEVTVLGESNRTLPFEISESKDTREDVRLQYRFLDLRNPQVHESILFRSKVVAFLRQKMTEMGFTEITTPILTCSSPEGARDYIIPSRKHEGKFYALPQAPQQFKQLLMTSGFDRYFQIAPASVIGRQSGSALPASSINWILKWPLPPRKMCLPWRKRCCMTPSPSSLTRK